MVEKRVWLECYGAPYEVVMPACVHFARVVDFSTIHVVYIVIKMFVMMTMHVATAVVFY